MKPFLTPRVRRGPNHKHNFQYRTNTFCNPKFARSVMKSSYDCAEREREKLWSNFKKPFGSTRLNSSRKLTKKPRGKEKRCSVGFHLYNQLFAYYREATRARVGKSAVACCFCCCWVERSLAVRITSHRIKKYTHQPEYPAIHCDACLGYGLSPAISLPYQRSQLITAANLQLSYKESLPWLAD